MVRSTGQVAPIVTARDQHGEPLELTYEEPTVLFFYPEDGTPGCTREAEQFELERETYREAGVRPIGVSTDTVESHRRFAEEQDLEFTLVADPDGDVCGAFDVDRDQGRAVRTTVVVVDGEIHRVYENVTPEGHAREVLMDLLDDGIVELPEP